MRQNNEENQLREVLFALRNYEAKPQHALWLQNFQWNTLRNKYGTQFIEDVERRGLFVFPSNQDVRNHNETKLKSLNKIHPVAKITAESKGIHVKSATDDKCRGLPKTLYLCKYSKVMITVNLSVKNGLFNGAQGFVVDVIYCNGRKPPNCFPDVVMVEIPTYTGPPFIEDCPKLVPIVPVERNIDCACHNCERKQLPLQLGWATTVHKCQGMTVREAETNMYVVIHPGTKQYES